MNRCDIHTLAEDFETLVLDVHGVVFNDPLQRFLFDVGERTREGGSALRYRWTHELRLSFWEGRIGDRELWRRLAPLMDADELRTDLESRYTVGPLFGLATSFPGSVWLLSNHHGPWLTDRLERFGIADRFERSLVSDALGAAKPDPRAFQPVVDLARHRSVLFIDDQIQNIATARSLGLCARLVDPSGAVVTPSTTAILQFPDQKGMP